MEQWQREQIERERAFCLALASMKRIGRRCDALGVGMQVTNRFRHWLFYRRNQVVQWRPRSGSILINIGKITRSNLQALSVPALLTLLRDVWKLPRRITLLPLEEPADLERHIARVTAYVLTPGPVKPRQAYAAYLAQYYNQIT